MALVGVSTTLATYINVAKAKGFSTVILPLSDNFLCFHILSVVFSVGMRCWKLCMQLFSMLSVITILSVSIGVFIHEIPCG